MSRMSFCAYEILVPALICLAYLYICSRNILQSLLEIRKVVDSLDDLAMTCSEATFSESKPPSAFVLHNILKIGFRIYFIPITFKNAHIVAVPSINCGLAELLQ